MDIPSLMYLSLYFICILFYRISPCRVPRHALKAGIDYTLYKSGPDEVHAHYTAKLSNLPPAYDKGMTEEEKQATAWTSFKVDKERRATDDIVHVSSL